MEHVEMEKKEGKKMYGKYEEYEIQNAADTLMQAEEIKADEEKMKYVKMCLEKKKKSIMSIADLKDRRKEMMDKDDYKEES